MIEPAVRQIIANDAAVVVVVGDRVWLGQRPQGERRPGVVLTRTGGGDPHCLDGSAGYETGTMQADVLCPSYAEAKQLARKVADALDNFSGTVAGVEIDWLSVDDEADIPAAPLEGKASPTFGVALEVSFMHQR
jgi:hypothetical protein